MRLAPKRDALCRSFAFVNRVETRGQQRYVRARGFLDFSIDGVQACICLQRHQESNNVDFTFAARCIHGRCCRRRTFAAEFGSSTAFADTAMPLAAQIPKLPDNNPFATAGAAPKETVPTHTTRKLSYETVNADNFAKFCVVLSDAGRKRLPINTYGDKLDLYREGFQSDQPTEWFIATFRNRGTGVLFLERHQRLTQTFIPVGGNGFFTNRRSAQLSRGERFSGTRRGESVLGAGRCRDSDSPRDMARKSAGDERR